MAAPRRLENIAEMAAHDSRGRRIHMKIDPPLGHDDERPDFVDPMRMIGVRMGQQDGVEPVDAEIEQLAAQIRRHVDENLRRAAVAPSSLEEDRTAPAAVLRIVGIAGAPALADARHAAGRAAAENGDRQGSLRGIRGRVRRRHFGKQPQDIGARHRGEFRGSRVL